MKQGENRIDAIVIGASAGGIEAIGTLLQALPSPYVPAVLVVLHVPPDKPSALPQLFGGRCRLPVREALDKESIERGTVYIAPPDYHLLVEPEKMLSLSKDAPVAFSRPSIDVTFESAAHAYGDRLLGVVLTGANSDGASGLATIRREGGRAWVQRPEEALARAMPAAAIEQAGADLILSLPDMAQRLAHLRSGRLVAI